jgi:hypothetical protein
MCAQILALAVCATFYHTSAARAGAVGPTPQETAEAAPAETSRPVLAQEPTSGEAAGPSAEQLRDLAKAAQNPVGNLTIIPFQSNWNYGAGPYARMLYNLNFQPVFPIYLSPRMNLIARTIVPVLNVPSNLPPQVCQSATGCGSTFGIGDTQEQLFFAPRKKPNELIWGVGPAFTFPTATPGTLGGGKYNAGLDAVALVMPGPWVIGALVTQQWTVAGQKNQPDQSNLFLQPFVNYNTKGGWALGTAPGITASFTAPGNQKWTVPVGGSVTYTTRVAQQPMSFALAYYTNVQKPQYAPQTQLRFTWSLIFPVKRK